MKGVVVVRRAARVLLLLIPALGLPACSTAPDLPHSDSALTCAESLDALERAAQSLGIDPGSPRRVDGFPELGTTRALAGLAQRELSSEEKADWLARLLEAGARRRVLLLEAVEAAKPPAGASPLLPDSAGSLQACAERLARSRQWTPVLIEQLRTEVRIPDAYSTANRVLGLYPLTSIPVRGAIRGLHQDLKASFSMPASALPVQGTLLRYEPEEVRSTLAQPLPRAPSDTLGVRLSAIDPALLELLAAHHAPILEIDVRGDYDRPGRPALATGGARTVDTAHPTLYRYAAVMPFTGRLRLQLIYVAWFTERPKTGHFDTLGGPIDGLVWRVTLDDDGAVLLYDSIHPCGCYHQFFPGKRLKARVEAAALPEPPLIPRAAPRLGATERPVLRIASSTHYLQQVYAGDRTSAVEPGAIRHYETAPYASLYALPGADGTSGGFFDARGRVPGSERGERFYLWPMGVPSPGAMRDRGRQATAFLGRRHFDDADLLDSLFLRAP